MGAEKCHIGERQSPIDIVSKEARLEHQHIVDYGGLKLIIAKVVFLKVSRVSALHRIRTRHPVNKERHSVC